MAKTSKMNVQQFKEWIEKQGASCRLGKGRLECVIDIDHIEPSHFAALYATPSPSGLLVVELAEYFPSEAAAWQGLQDEISPVHPYQLSAEWVKEQYLTDKNARVERLEI